MTSTIGLPLWAILMECQERGLVVDWIEYYKSALSSGMSPDRILTRIDSEVSDVYGPEYRDEVIKRLKVFIPSHLL